MRTDRSALLGLLALSAVLLVGCPGTLEHPERFLVAVAGAAGSGGGDAAPPVDAGHDDGPCGDVVTRIFIPSCGGTGCHSATAPQQGLDLVSPGVSARVVGVPGTGCASLLADPTNPEASLIYQKLSPTPPCGAPMPLSRPALSDDDAACVLAWIEAQ